MGELDRIGYACHFDREVSKGHGVPFRYVVKDVSIASKLQGVSL